VLRGRRGDLSQRRSGARREGEVPGRIVDDTGEAVELYPLGVTNRAARTEPRPTTDDAKRCPPIDRVAHDLTDIGDARRTGGGRCRRRRQRSRGGRTGSGGVKR